MADIILEAQNLTKVYGSIKALANVSIEVYEGEFFSLIGPSASGKSTLLKILACVETPSEGRILYRGERLTSSSLETRDLVMVWQSLALFPHMNVEANVSFGLGVRGVNQQTKSTRVQEVLSMVGLDGYHKRRVRELSGGEQQRVALARALAVSPKVLLLDEPLGSLDAHLRGELQVALVQLHRETGVTFIMVTHDQSEALTLSDRIGVINAGRIEQVGTPEEIMKLPNTPFVARFVGQRTVLDGVLKKESSRIYTVETKDGEFHAHRSTGSMNQIKPGSEIAYVVNADRILPGVDHENVVKGFLAGVFSQGSRQLVLLRLPSGNRLVFEKSGYETSTFIGDNIEISWATEDAYIIPIDSTSLKSLP